MARKIPDGRFEQLVRCATRVFVLQGYRRTQMADVAEALGVAKGTLYLYVESKEALFDLAIRYADAPEQVGQPLSLPIPTPPRGATVRFVSDLLAANQMPPTLAAALGGGRVRDAAAELEAILRELFDVLARNRNGIELLDRSARDHPELAALWFEGARGGLMAGLEEYLLKRIRAKQLRPVPSIPLAARLMIETTVFWAVHRHWDEHPQEMSEAEALEVVVRFIVGALAKAKEQSAWKRDPR